VDGGLGWKIAEQRAKVGWLAEDRKFADAALCRDDAELLRQRCAGVGRVFGWDGHRRVGLHRTPPRGLSKSKTDSLLLLIKAEGGVGSFFEVDDEVGEVASFHRLLLRVGAGAGEVGVGANLGEDFEVGGGVGVGVAVEVGIAGWFLGELPGGEELRGRFAVVEEGERDVRGRPCGGSGEIEGSGGDVGVEDAGVWAAASDAKRRDTGKKEAAYVDAGFGALFRRTDFVLDRVSSNDSKNSKNSRR